MTACSLFIRLKDQKGIIPLVLSKSRLYIKVICSTKGEGVIVNEHSMVVITTQIIVRCNIYCAMQYILLASPAGSDICMRTVRLQFSSNQTDQNS